MELGQIKVPMEEDIGTFGQNDIVRNVAKYSSNRLLRNGSLDRLFRHGPFGYIQVKALIFV